jgi:hypothetical protein
MGRVKRGLRRFRVPLMAAAAIAVLIGGVVIANDRLATSGAEPCFEQQRGDIRAGQDPKLAVKPTADDRLKLVLDHQIEDARRDDVSVAVVTYDNAASVTELPVEPNVGARIDETPRAAEPLAFRVVAKGEPTDDGRGIVVSACTVRPNRDTSPGAMRGSCASEGRASCRPTCRSR